MSDSDLDEEPQRMEPIVTNTFFTLDDEDEDEDFYENDPSQDRDDNPLDLISGKNEGESYRERSVPPAPSYDVESNDRYVIKDENDEADAVTIVTSSGNTGVPSVLKPNSIVRSSSTNPLASLRNSVHRTGSLTSVSSSTTVRWKEPRSLIRSTSLIENNDILLNYAGNSPERTPPMYELCSEKNETGPKKATRKQASVTTQSQPAPTNQLILTIHKGSNFLLNEHGKCEPYVVLRKGPNIELFSSQKMTRDPTWEERIQIPDANDHPLEIGVYDVCRGQGYSFIGGHLLTEREIATTGHKVLHLLPRVQETDPQVLESKNNLGTLSVSWQRTSAAPSIEEILSQCKEPGTAQDQQEPAPNTQLPPDPVPLKSQMRAQSHDVATVSAITQCGKESVSRPGEYFPEINCTLALSFFHGTRLTPTTARYFIKVVTDDQEGLTSAVPCLRSVADWQEELRVACTTHSIIPIYLMSTRSEAQPVAGFRLDVGKLNQKGEIEMPLKNEFERNMYPSTHVARLIANGCRGDPQVVGTIAFSWKIIKEETVPHLNDGETLTYRLSLFISRGMDFPVSENPGHHGHSIAVRHSGYEGKSLAQKGPHPNFDQEVVFPSSDSQEPIEVFVFDEATRQDVASGSFTAPTFDGERVLTLYESRSPDTRVVFGKVVMHWKRSVVTEREENQQPQFLHRFSNARDRGESFSSNSGARTDEDSRLSLELSSNDHQRTKFSGTSTTARISPRPPGAKEEAPVSSAPASRGYSPPTGNAPLLPPPTREVIARIHNHATQLTPRWKSSYGPPVQRSTTPNDPKRTPTKVVERSPRINKQPQLNPLRNTTNIVKHSNSKAIPVLNQRTRSEPQKENDVVGISSKRGKTTHNSNLTGGLARVSSSSSLQQNGSKMRIGPHQVAPVMQVISSSRIVTATTASSISEDIDPRRVAKVPVVVAKAQPITSDRPISRTTKHPVSPNVRKTNTRQVLPSRIQQSFRSHPQFRASVKPADHSSKPSTPNLQPLLNDSSVLESLKKKNIYTTAASRARSAPRSTVRTRPNSNYPSMQGYKHSANNSAADAKEFRSRPSHARRSEARTRSSTSSISCGILTSAFHRREAPRSVSYGIPSVNSKITSMKNVETHSCI